MAADETAILYTVRRGRVAESARSCHQRVDCVVKCNVEQRIRMRACCTDCEESQEAG